MLYIFGKLLQKHKVCADSTILPFQCICPPAAAALRPSWWMEPPQMILNWIDFPAELLIKLSSAEHKHHNLVNGIADGLKCWIADIFHPLKHEYLQSFITAFFNLVHEIIGVVPLKSSLFQLRICQLKLQH